MNYKIFDAHCDTLTALTESETLSENSRMVRLDMFKKYSGFVQCFAAWINTKEGNLLRQALEVAARFYEETEKNDITPIFSANDLDSVIKNDKNGAILTLEDGAALQGSISVLNMLYKLGFRSLTLTWNGRNELGDGAVGGKNKGLTDFGKKVIGQMNELGMVVDVSHLSERGFWDVAELSSKPFIASHSNAKKICNHPRNLSDEQIMMIIKKGGAVGINLYSVFLNGTNNAFITDVIRHIEHIISLGGENFIGLGTDFDGMDYAAKGIENAEELYKLFNELQKLGYSDDIISKLSYKNFCRVYREILA